MQGDDLAVFGILWGTAIAFALAAVTMIDSSRKKILSALWAIAGLFLVTALLWRWIAEKWPQAKTVAQFVSGNELAIDVVGLAIFCLLVWDFRTRQRWLAKVDKSSRALEIEQQRISRLITSASEAESVGGEALQNGRNK